MNAKTTVSNDCWTTGVTSRKTEFLDLMRVMDDKTASFSISLIFDVLRSWEDEYGRDSLMELMEAACQRVGIDSEVGRIYIICPKLIEPMEALRTGKTIRQVRDLLAISEEGHQWWHAVLVIRTLLKCDGTISHVRLLRWLGHKADRGQVRAALENLRNAGVVESFQTKGNDPLRPRMWHRLTSSFKQQGSISFKKY
jgi:hypothetical protein